MRRATAVETVPVRSPGTSAVGLRPAHGPGRNASAARAGIPLAALIVLALATVAAAHHSIAAVYDRARPVTLDAVVVEFALVQPHPFLVVDVTTRGGTTERWRGELDNRWELVAIGIDAQTFTPGERLTMRGSTARDGTRALYVVRIDRPADGFWYEQTGMTPSIGRK